MLELSREIRWVKECGKRGGGGGQVINKHLLWLAVKVCGSGGSQKDGDRKNLYCKFL